MCAPRVHKQITNCGVQHRPQLQFKHYLVDNLSLKINYDYNCIRRRGGRVKNVSILSSYNWEICVSNKVY